MAGGVLGLLVFAGVITSTVPALAQAGARRVTAQEITDEDVVEAIRRGAKYLLASKKVDNWEAGAAAGIGLSQRHFLGGETAIVLYALLHAGRGLQDDEELGPKLTFRSPELSPVVAWLSKIEPEGTYAAGLQANAMALIPKGTPAGKDALASLEHCRDYLLTAMGADGGYWYESIDSRGFERLSSAYQKYVDVRARKGTAAEISDAKAALDDCARHVRMGFGGLEWLYLVLSNQAKGRAEEAKAKNDKAAQQREEFEVQELKALAAAARNVSTTQRADLRVTEARRGLANLQARLKTDAKTPRDELLKELEGAKANLADAEAELARDRAGFNPFGDLSNGQYGALGAWALADYGMELPIAYWQIQDRFWRKLQRPDGTWPYDSKGDGNGRIRTSMVVAGLASLYVTSDFTETQVRLEPKPDTEIQRGLAWLDKNYDGAADLYTQYGYERTGLASGLKFWATQDWYRTGAATVINRQAADGSWNEHGTNVGTAYALLFLARGRNPVMFNKLQYNGSWNARPRDSANITDWVSKKFERPINWQVVDINVKSEEWQDAPVLLITGSKALELRPEQVANIRAYVEAGGMVFSNADGGKPEFTESIKKIAGAVVTGASGQAKYEMRELPKDHILFSKELWADVKNPPKLLGMSNGLREVWIHSTVDMGASWQGRRVATPEHFEIPANLYFYSSGKGRLHPKLVARSADDANKIAPRHITVARIDYEGNDDPEPGAWRRMARIARAQFGTDVTLKSVKLADLNAKETPLAHMTGTTEFPIKNADVTALKKFLAEGGTLFADASGGSAKFTLSFSELVAKVSPERSLNAIPASCPLIAGPAPDGKDISRADFRRYFLAKVRAARGVNLQGIEMGGRYAVVFAPEDVTSGLLGTETWGIAGYAPESAEKIVRNIILYTLDPKAPAAGAVPESTSAPAGGK